jgi:hypothetical protein
MRLGGADINTFLLNDHGGADGDPLDFIAVPEYGCNIDLPYQHGTTARWL